MFFPSPKADRAERARKWGENFSNRIRKYKIKYLLPTIFMLRYKKICIVSGEQRQGAKARKHVNSSIFIRDVWEGAEWNFYNFMGDFQEGGAKAGQTLQIWWLRKRFLRTDKHWNLVATFPGSSIDFGINFYVLAVDGKLDIHDKSILMTSR